jgi:hypothetical protein
MRQLINEVFDEVRRLSDYNFFWILGVFPVFIFLDVLVFAPVIRWATQMDFSVLAVYGYTFCFTVIFLFLLFLWVFSAGLASVIINRIAGSAEEIF